MITERLLFSIAYAALLIGIGVNIGMGICTRSQKVEWNKTTHVINIPVTDCGPRK